MLAPSISFFWVANGEQKYGETSASLIWFDLIKSPQCKAGAFSGIWRLYFGHNPMILDDSASGLRSKR